jgi:hypothetical protein
MIVRVSPPQRTSAIVHATRYPRARSSSAPWHPYSALTLPVTAWRGVRGKGMTYCVDHLNLRPWITRCCQPVSSCLCLTPTSLLPSSFATSTSPLLVYMMGVCDLWTTVLWNFEHLDPIPLQNFQGKEIAIDMSPSIHKLGTVNDVAYDRTSKPIYLSLVVKMSIKSWVPIWYLYLMVVD